MPPSSNDAQDQSQPQNQLTTNANPNDTPVTPLPDNTPPPAANNTAPLSNTQIADTSPEVSEVTELYDNPAVSSADIPANNRPTLDTINSTPSAEGSEPNTPQENPGAEKDNLPESYLPNDPYSEESTNPPESAAPASNDITNQANTESPAPTPAVFPESENKPKKKGFLAKLFNKN